MAPELTITCPADATLEADEDCSADTSTDALGNAMYTATDNCDTDLDISLTHEDVLTEGCEGSYTAPGRSRLRPRTTVTTPRR